MPRGVQSFVLVSVLLVAGSVAAVDVTLRDGTVVTAYYANRVPDHRRYHMGVVIWDPTK